ncbi:hypothetical protein V6N13_114076 [Hibiscus sabdariffa]
MKVTNKRRHNGNNQGTLGASSENSKAKEVVGSWFVALSVLQGDVEEQREAQPVVGSIGASKGSLPTKSAKLSGGVDALTNAGRTCKT